MKQAWVIAVLIVLLCSSCKENDRSVENLKHTTSELLQTDSRKQTGDTKVDVVNAKAILSSDDVLKFVSPGEMLNIIYQQKGDGSSSYEIENGARATFWFGHSYSLAGKNYYTGFAYASKERFGEALNADPAPGDEVALSAITMLLSDQASEKPLELLNADQFIGQAGGYDQMPVVDDRQVVTHTTSKNQYLLGIPVQYSAAGGVVSESYELMLRSASENEEGDYWGYVGNIVTSESNEAGCLPDEEDIGFTQCYRNVGKLSFEPGEQDLPLIKVIWTEFKDSENGSAAEPKIMGKDTYFYDKDKKSYVITKRK